MPLSDKGSSIQHWSLVDRLVQQIVLQYEDGNDPDVSPFDINFKDVIEKVINQDIIRQRKAEEKEKGECVVSIILQESYDFFPIYHWWIKNKN